MLCSALCRVAYGSAVEVGGQVGGVEAPQPVDGLSFVAPEELASVGDGGHERVEPELPQDELEGLEGLGHLVRLRELRSGQVAEDPVDEGLGLREVQSVVVTPEQAVRTVLPEVVRGQLGDDRFTAKGVEQPEEVVRVQAAVRRAGVAVVVQALPLCQELFESRGVLWGVYAALREWRRTRLVECHSV